MEDRSMKKLALGLALSAAAAAQISATAVPVRAAPVAPANPGRATATVQVDAQQIQVNARAPIPFQPFPLVDFRTGQPLSPKAIITLHNGKRIAAGAYFAQLNELERQFNALGYSLRDPATVKLQELKVDRLQLQGQMSMLQALSPVGNTSPATQGGGSNAVPMAVTPPGGAHIASVPKGLVGVRPVLGYSPQSMSKNWDYWLGSQDTIGAELSGQINVTGSDQGVSANGSSRASGAILGDEWDLVRVTGNVNAPKSGLLSAKVDLYVVGVGDTSLIDQSVNQPVLNASGSQMRPLDVHQDFHFSVGPIPMSARLGVRGSAGVQYAVTLHPVQAGVTLQPKVQVDAYGEGGVDLDIASGGIGCDLELLHDEVQFGTQAGIITDASGPALQAHCYASDSLEALGGRLYAYAKIDLGIYDKEWDWDIWDFEGIKKDFTLFDDAQTLQLVPQQLVARA
jgi:hypothetical protein